MKRSFLLSTIFLAALFFASCGNQGSKNSSETVDPNANTGNATAPAESAVTTVKKYGIKSAIVTFESDGMGIKQKIVLYFDDFGAKETEEKYDLENNLSASTICDGTNRYTLVYKDKTFQNDGACSRGIAYKFDWDEVSKADPKYKPQKLANITIAGKDCESFSLETSGNTIIYAGWNNICFLIDQNTQYGKITYKAISFDENAVISSDKFKVPGDFQIK